MQLKNIIKSVGDILNIQDNATIRRCANLVLGNIAANHRDCIATQTFNVTDNKIRYSDFEKTFLRIHRINVEHSLYVNYIRVPNGRVTVKYGYIPEFINDDDEIIIPNLTEQCFTYGVLTEYAIINGMFNEARIWSDKFEAELFGTSPKNRNIVLPARAK